MLNAYAADQEKIVTDDSMQPVAVLIDYEDWQKIEQILEATQSQSEFGLNRYAGVIQLTEDLLNYQQNVRDEW